MKDLKKECPEELKGHMHIPLHKGLKINPEKTLSEIGVKNGEIILFMLDNNSNKTKIKKKEENDKLTEDEVKQTKKCLDEYKAMKFMKHLVNNFITDSDNDNIIPLESRESMQFIDYVIEKEIYGDITFKEHNHKLVYCLTNSG